MVKLLIKDKIYAKIEVPHVKEGIFVAQKTMIYFHFMLLVG